MGKVYHTVNVFKEEEMLSDNFQKEVRMSFIYLFLTVVTCLTLFIWKMAQPPSQVATTMTNPAYTDVLSLDNREAAGSISSLSCPCQQTQISFGSIVKLDWVPFAFCRSDVGLVNTYNTCKQNKICRTADPFRFNLLALFAFLCPVANDFATKEVAIFKNRNVPTTDAMSNASLYQTLSFYEQVVEQNVKVQLSTPITIQRALSYVDRPLTPIYSVVSASDGAALIYNSTFKDNACFCNLDYLCTIPYTYAANVTFDQGCNYLETYLSLTVTEALNIVKTLIDTKPIESKLSASEKSQTVQDVISNGMVHQWRNDIAVSHKRYINNYCKPASCKFVQSQSNSDIFKAAVTQVLAVVGGATTGIKIIVSLGWIAYEKYLSKKEAAGGNEEENKEGVELSPQ
eukprot:TRINITY_DN4838_c0_g1_i1.p1 TRINITY_DN4838_c0_g1~~TRINITY_DN4838_c0_g1_i1.p1  ORF type:complete len:400 (+),score=109.33 TRINITY_DN4838_c0_g1_i1:107-1306(+)